MIGRLETIGVSRWHVLGVACFFLGWSLLSHWLGGARLPSLASLAAAIRDSITGSQLLASRVNGHPTIIVDLAYTAALAIVGMVVGSAAGIAWGISLSLSRAARAFTNVPIEVLRILPPLAALPFFLMWFGPSPLTQFLLICLYAFLRMVIMTMEAIRNIMPATRQYALTMGASRPQMLATVVLPAIAPEVLGGMRVVLAEAWGLQIVAELLGSRYGLGHVLSYLILILKIDFILAAAFWLTVVAYVTDRFVFVPLSTRLTRWVPRKEQGM